MPDADAAGTRDGEADDDVDASDDDVNAGDARAGDVNAGDARADDVNAGDARADDAGSAPAGEDSEPGAGASAAPLVPGGPGLWGKASVRAAASVAAAVVAAGIVWGAAAALRGSPPPVPADARIPSPPAKNHVFVADHYKAGQDQQDNVLQFSAPGMILVESASGTELGSGFVITRSGYALAAYHGLSGAGALTVRLVISGRTCSARVVGSDPGANLALLQLSGTGFAPVAIGTANDVSLADRVASGGGNAAATGVVLSTGAITGIDVPVTLDGTQLTGLLRVSSLDAPADELGGPLFNLSGQVIGINVGWGPAGGYDVPIDAALQVARQIAGQ